MKINLSVAVPLKINLFLVYIGLYFKYTIFILTRLEGLDQ